MSLIHSQECEESKVSKSESEAFLQEVEEAKEETQKQEEQQDADDLVCIYRLSFEINNLNPFFLNRDNIWCVAKLKLM